MILDETDECRELVAANGQLKRKKVGCRDVDEFR